MIQRIQSVFLFLLAIAVISMLFLPLWSKTDATTGETVVLNAFNIKSQVQNEQVDVTGEGSLPAKSSIAIGLLAIAAAVIAVLEIFKYRNRLTQMKLGLLNTLVLAALLGTSFYYAAYVGNEMVTGTDYSYYAGFYMPMLALLLNAFANRFIKRDEDLVRSADRLR